MSLYSIDLVGRVACALVVSGLLYPLSGTPATAEDVSASEIINALTPEPVTRGLTTTEHPAMSPADQAFVESIRHRSRSLTLDEADRAAAIAIKKKDVEVYFDYNSAEISPKTETQLQEIGKALDSPQLANSVWVLAGHTDAKGGDDYNQRLSERRAEAVKRYLLGRFKIPAENLSTAGFGKRHLRDVNHPFASENRRVQILNLGPPSEAKR